MTQLSKYLSLEMAIDSATADRLNIDNTPNAEQIEALTAWGINIYDKVAGKYHLIQLNSIFRCHALNTAIGGSKTSQHCKGEAGDLKLASRKENTDMLRWAIKNLVYDQMIIEFPNEEGGKWLHISYTAKGKNRGQILVASGVQTGIGATYTPFTGRESWFISDGSKYVPL